MKYLLFYRVFLLTSLFAIASCNSNSAIEERLNKLEKENDELKKQVQKADTISDNTFQSNFPINRSSSKQFAYVLIESEEPSLNIMEIPAVIGDPFSRTTWLYTVDWKKGIYTTEIQELDAFNDEIKYKLLDAAERGIEMDFFANDHNYKQDVQLNVRDSEEQRRLENKRCRVSNRECFVFDSYKEASLHKHKKTE